MLCSTLLIFYFYICLLMTTISSRRGDRISLLAASLSLYFSKYKKQLMANFMLAKKSAKWDSL